MKPIKQAFTLIELIVLITVLGVLIAVSIPSFTSEDGIERYTQLRLLRDKVRYAGDYNISTGQPVRISFLNAGSASGEIQIDFKNSAGLWTPLQVAGESGPLYLEMGQGEFAQLELTQVNINAGTVIILDSMGQPRDQNGNLLPTGISHFFRINSNIDFRFHPVSGYLEMVSV